MRIKSLFIFKINKDQPAMTYNFDFEKWYDNEITFLEARLRLGKTPLAEWDSSENAFEVQL